MEQIRLKWLEDKARQSSIAWFQGDVGNPVHLNSLWLNQFLRKRVALHLLNYANNYFCSFSL